MLGERAGKRIDIEKLLQWALRDELPKKHGSMNWGFDMSPMFRLADLGTRVDDWSEEPGYPAAMGECHPDALIVDEVLATLDDAEIDWPATRPNIMGNLAPLVSDYDPTLSCLTIGRVGLVAMHARMGTRPRDWDMQPAPEPIVGRNGKPVVQFLDDDGHTLVEGRKAGHYGPGARCPMMWFPPPREVAFARIEYDVWHYALVELTITIAGYDLKDHIVLPPAAPETPWAPKEVLTTSRERHAA